MAYTTYRIYWDSIGIQCAHDVVVPYVYFPYEAIWHCYRGEGAYRFQYLFHVVRNRSLAGDISRIKNQSASLRSYLHAIFVVLKLKSAITGVKQIQILPKRQKST